MEKEEALEIISMIVDGYDPYKEKEPTKNLPEMNPITIRALCTAITSLLTKKDQIELAAKYIYKKPTMFGDSVTGPLQTYLKEKEKEVIFQSLYDADFNRSNAASKLEITLDEFESKIIEHGLESELSRMALEKDVETDYISYVRFSNLDPYLELIEKNAVKTALVKTSYNKNYAADILGISFRSLRYRIEKRFKYGNAEGYSIVSDCKLNYFKYQNNFSFDDFKKVIEKKIIELALQETRFNKNSAANLLGISFRSLRYRIDKLGTTEDETKSPKLFSLVKESVTIDNPDDAKTTIGSNLFEKERDAISKNELYDQIPRSWYNIYITSDLFRHDDPVIINGEIGTYREILALAIHKKSYSRSDAPFVPLNCYSLISKEILKTYSEIANSGTIFLDEITELQEHSQILLLDFLQQAGDVVVKHQTVSDIRVIAGTKKNIRKEVENNKFLKDLYKRLNVIPINIIPLRHRKDDIPQFIDHFLKLEAQEYNLKPYKLSPEAVEIMLDYPWPGNLRELYQSLRSAIVKCSGNQIVADDLPPNIRNLRDKLSKLSSSKNLDKDSENLF